MTSSKEYVVKHDKIVKRIEDLGHEKGFSARKGTTAIGDIDCVWYLPFIGKEIPVIAFELTISTNNTINFKRKIFSELAKMMILGPSLAVFIVPQKKVNYIQGVLKSSKVSINYKVFSKEKFEDYLSGEIDILTNFSLKKESS